MNSPSIVRIVCLRSAHELTGFQSEIDRLNLESMRPDPFSTYEFYANLLKHGDWCIDRARSQLCFLAAFRNKRMIGYLALKEVTIKGWPRSTRRLDFLVGHEADRPHVVARPENLREVTERFYRFLADQKGWDFLEFEQQESGSSLYSPPESIRFRHSWVGHSPGWDNCTIPIRWRTLSSYVGCMSRNMRSSLRRHLRALSSLGELELIASADPHATPALFALYCGVESRSWKSNTSIAIGGDTRRTRYFEALLDGRQPMRIVIHILLLDGIPIAGLLCGSFVGPAHKGLYGLHIAFDHRLSKVSPGSAVLLMGMHYAIAHEYAFFNLLAGFDYYKTRWLAKVTPTASVQIYRVGSMLFAHRVCGNLKRALAPNRALRYSRPKKEFDREPPGIGTWLDEQKMRDEQSRYYPLIARALHGVTEYSSASQLRSDLSFLTSRSLAAGPPTLHRKNPEALIAG